jgi:hypothetical protein
MFPVYGTRIREHFSITAEQFGALMGLKSLGRIPGLFSVGPAIDRVGVSRIAELSMVGLGGGFLILGIGGSLFWFQFAMPVLGLFLGLFSVAIPAFLIALFPALKRRIFSVMLVAVAAPSMLYPLLANRLLEWSAGRGELAFETVLYVPFLIVGSILAVGGALLAIGKRAQVRAQVEKTHPIRLKALFSLRSLVIVVLLSLHAGADNTLFYFLPMFMEAHFEQLPLAPAWAISGHGLAYVITRSVLSLWPEGLGHRAILTLAGPLGGSIVILTLWLGSPFYIPIFYTFASLLFAAEYPVLVSEVSSRSMGEFGSTLGCGLLVSEVVTFVFLRGTGRLADLTGDYRLALSAASCGFIAFGVIAAIAGLGRRHRPAGK